MTVPFFMPLPATPPLSAGLRREAGSMNPFTFVCRSGLLPSAAVVLIATAQFLYY